MFPLTQMACRRARSNFVTRCYNFVADIIHTKKLCSRLSLSEVQFHTENGRFAFLSPLPLGNLGGNV